MTWPTSAIDIANFAFSVASLGALILVLAGSRRDATTWLLAAFFALPASSIITNLDVPPILFSDVTLAYSVRLFGVSWQLALYPIYLAFAARAISSPLVRPLARPAAQIGLVTIALAELAAPFLFPQTFLTTRSHFIDGVWSWDYTDFSTQAISWSGLPVFTYTLLAGLDALRRAAPGSAVRKRTAWYVLAFGVNDVAWLIFTIGTLPNLHIDTLVPVIISDYGSVAAAILLAVALVRHQLFDFDLRVKWTIRRGTVAAVFIAVFFVAAQLAQSFLTGALGWLTGGIAAGLLLFLLRPLERAADRLADRAMPNVAPTSTYVAYKKLEVYRAALESAHETGGVTPKERAALDRLRAKLGIEEPDAAAVELDVTAR